MFRPLQNSRPFAAGVNLRPPPTIAHPRRSCESSIFYSGRLSGLRKVCGRTPKTENCILFGGSTTTEDLIRRRPNTASSRAFKIFMLLIIKSHGTNLGLFRNYRPIVSLTLTSIAHDIVSAGHGETGSLSLTEAKHRSAFSGPRGALRAYAAS